MGAVVQEVVPAWEMAKTEPGAAVAPVKERNVKIRVAVRLDRGHFKNIA